MLKFSQKDLRWSSNKLGTGRNTIGSDGCFIDSGGMLGYMSPDVVNELMIKAHGYANRDRVISEVLAKVLGVEYNGITTKKPDHICIAETAHYSPRQHFFVFAPAGTLRQHEDMMIDPLDHPDVIGWTPVKYKIKTYRLFEEKEPAPIEGVPEYWSGNRPFDNATRMEVFHYCLPAYEEYLKKKYNLKE